jgi:hypothetical protein
MNGRPNTYMPGHMAGSPALLAEAGLNYAYTQVFHGYVDAGMLLHGRLFVMTGAMSLEAHLSQGT